MRGLLPFVSTVLLATQSPAAPVQVISGEHDTYSRLVLNIPSGVRWSVQGSGNKRVLRFDGHEDGFETSSVFSRIPRKRLSSLQASSSTILLHLNCNCDISTQILRTGQLVLDIQDQFTRPKARPILTEDPEAVGKDRVKFDWSTTQFPAASTPSPGRTNVGSDVEYLLKSQSKLLRDFSRAATMGVLVPKETAMAPNLATIQASKDARHHHPLPLKAIPSTSRAQITVSNSMDRLPSEKNSVDNQTSRGESCDSPESLDVPSWGDNTAFGKQLGAARTLYMGEFDKVTTDARLGLVRTYLYFGFGAEARMILEEDPQLRAIHPELRSLSDLFDFGSASPPNAMASMADCASDLALWGIISQDKLTRSASVNTDAALNALERLPDHLRAYIAPILSARLSELGEKKAAKTAIHNIARTVEPLSSSALLAQVNLELSNEKLRAAESQLQIIINENAEMSPHALIKYMEIQRASGRTIPLDFIQLLEAYSSELRDHPIYEQLQKSLILSNATNGHFGAALTELGERAEQFDDKSELYSVVLGEIASKADDISFLAYVYDQPSEDLQSTSSDILLSITRRLVTLGFSDRASLILAQVPLTFQRNERQVLAGQIALNMDQPIRTISELFEINGDAADFMRAQANLKIGNLEQATTLFKGLGRTEFAETTAFLAPNWTELVDQGSHAFGPVLALAKTALPEIRVDDEMLQNSGTAIDQSVQARSAIFNMLSSVPAPE